MMKVMGIYSNFLIPLIIPFIKKYILKCNQNQWKLIIILLSFSDNYKQTVYWMKTIIIYLFISHKFQGYLKNEYIIKDIINI